jgi:hypothetical protein
MKRLAFVIFLLLCLPVAGRADDASKRVKIQELFVLLHTERLTDEMMDRVMKQTSSFSNQIAGAKLTPDMKTKLADFQKRVFDLVSAQISWKDMEPQYVELYAQTYTEPELDAMLTFYKSPEGSSIIGKTSGVMAKSSELAQTRLNAIQPQLITMLQDFAKSAAATANSTAKGAGPSK